MAGDDPSTVVAALLFAALLFLLLFAVVCVLALCVTESTELKNARAKMHIFLSFIAVSNVKLDSAI